MPRELSLSLVSVQYTVHLKGQRHEIFDILSVSNYSLWSPMNRLKRFSEIFRLREDIREKPESS